MQLNPPVPTTWQEFIWLTVAAILGYSATHLSALFRKRLTDAETKKTEAETRSIDIETMIQSGGFMVDLMKASAQATLDAERLRKEKEFWQAKAEALQNEKHLLEIQLDEQIRIGRE